MTQEAELQRRLTLVEQLSVEHGWGLTQEQQAWYAQQSLVHNPAAGGSSTASLRIMFQYYHTEHELVQILVNPSHPKHTDVWMEWTRSVLRILVVKSAGNYIAIDSAISLDDLVQEAMVDLWNGIQKFHYQSRLQTWAFTVVSNCLARHYRSLHAKKRIDRMYGQSLEGALLVEESLALQVAYTPDDIAFQSCLESLVRKVLEQHPDRRVLMIFDLWANEERTLREIGEQVHLSASRVHALLCQALVLLRNDPALQNWIESESESESADVRTGPPTTGQVGGKQNMHRYV